MWILSEPVLERWVRTIDGGFMISWPDRSARSRAFVEEALADRLVRLREGHGARADRPAVGCERRRAVLAVERMLSPRTSGEFDCSRFLELLADGLHTAPD